MKLLIALATLIASMNVFAGSLSIEVKGYAGYGSEMKYYTLEKRGSDTFLYLQDKQNNSCRVPVSLLKDLGMDPLQTGHLLLNSGESAPVFICEMTRDEEGSTRKAFSISFTSFPKP